MSYEFKRIEGVEKNEGKGAKVIRLFPTEKYNNHHDPFILMDEFFVSPPNSFPSHEHRGFEAITYIIEGSFVHEDNLGNIKEVGPGGVQAFNAGKSIIHSETPGGKERSHGIQLWVNLPSSDKNSDPEYQQLNAEDVNISKSDEITVRTIAGNNSNLKLHTDISFKDISITASTKYFFEITDKYVGIIYLIKGNLVNLSNHETLLKPGEGLLIEKDTRISFSAESKSRFIEIKGRPHGNKIKIKGTFVE